jgi:hypothetical protein
MTSIGLTGRLWRSPVVFVPVEIETLRTSLLDELLVLEMPLEILNERPLLVALILLEWVGRREPERRGDGGCPTGFRGGTCRGGPGIEPKFCLPVGGDPTGSGELRSGQEP